MYISTKRLFFMVCAPLFFCITAMEDQQAPEATDLVLRTIAVLKKPIPKLKRWKSCPDVRRSSVREQLLQIPQSDEISARKEQRYTRRFSKSSPILTTIHESNETEEPAS